MRLTTTGECETAQGERENLVFYFLKLGVFFLSFPSTGRERRSGELALYSDGNKYPVSPGGMKLTRERKDRGPRPPCGPRSVLGASLLPATFIGLPWKFFPPHLEGKLDTF